MSTASQQIWFDNPNVGQRSRFVTLPGETGGTRFVLEYIDQPFAGEQAVPPHIHTAVTETFEILEGRARYRLGSETKTAQAGDRVIMPPMVTHVHPWSDSDEELHVRQIAESSPPDLCRLECRHPGRDHDSRPGEGGPRQLEGDAQSAAARRPHRRDDAGHLSGGSADGRQRALFGAMGGWAGSPATRARIGVRRRHRQRSRHPSMVPAGVAQTPAARRIRMSGRRETPMGLTDFLRSQFIEIIEWTDDSRDTLSYRFPDDDKEIKRGAQLIVRESQSVQFVYLGQYGDLFGPGTHTLTTDNIPILSRLKGWKYGFESPFKADVYYLTTRLFTGNKWGTSNPVMVRDQDFGIVRVRAFGTYDFRIVDPPKFLKEVAGTDNHFRLDEFADVMRSRMVSVFSEALASSKVPVLDVATRYSELGDALLPLINPALNDKYGIAMPAFVIENVSVPPEVEQAIDKRSSMAAVGNLNDYVKYQMAQGLEKGGGGVAGVGAEIAVGCRWRSR